MRILFVCLANTCRSPMAEAVMQKLINQNQLDWQTDSAALRDWNVGYLPQERCICMLAENNLETKHLSRLITREDFQTIDYILCMDENNLSELQQLANIYGVKSGCQIELLGTYLKRKEDEIIRDPYFTNGMGGFRAAYAQIYESCVKFVQQHTNN